MSKKMATTCRLQELLKRPIFPTVGLLAPQSVTFTSADSLSPHLSQILANSEQRLNVPNPRLHVQNQHHSHQHSAQLASHLQAQLQPKRRYCCSQCPYSTDRRDLFRRHENIHRDEKPFRCYVCNKMFNRADHVKKHFLRIHKGIEYDVKLTKRIKGVDYDVKEPADSNGLANSASYMSNSASKCFPVFSAPYSYANAIQFAAINLKEEQIFKVAPEPLPEQEVPIVVLKESEEPLKNLEPEPEETARDALEANSVEYECEFCGCAFLNYPSLHTHRYLLHRYVTDSANCFLYRCVICGQKSITQKAMIQHMLRHSSSSTNNNGGSSSNSNNSGVGGRRRCNNSTPSEGTKPKSKSNLCKNRRKQSQPKKIVKSVVNVVTDLLEIEKSEKLWVANKFTCKICHKHFSTYTQQIQHQMFSKHYH